MFSRSYILIGLALLFALVIAFPAFAGGWAVITLDELPSNVMAGESLTIGFTVRQHGITPMNGLEPTVTATLLKGEQFVVYAEPDGKPGHYTAILTFPKEGNWEWSIQAFTMDQPMPALTVSTSNTALTDQPASNLESNPVSMDSMLILRTLVFGLGMVGLVLALQQKSRVAGALAGLCFVVGLGTFVMGTATPQVAAQSERSLGSSPSQIELGRQLFLAKGCITCHYNDRAGNRNEYQTIDIGAPNLSNYSAHPEVLFIRLKDPVAAKSDAKMPNLELKETEIEALIAFINSK